MAVKRIWKRLLLGVIVFIVAFATLGVPYLIAVLATRAGTRPQDLGLTSSPVDYDLGYEDVTFTTSDGVALSGWYLEGNHEVAIAVGHGLFRSRREVLDRAAFFRKLGFDTLVFDFRRHGKSAGERCTLGYKERLDFEAAVDYLRAQAPHARVLLYGVSMGAAAAVLAGRETTSVEALIVDSPFYSIEHTVVHHAKLIFGLPRFPFATALLFFLQLRGGFDLTEFELEPAVADLGERPILIVAGGDDRRMPVAYQRRLFEASRSEKSKFRVVEKAGHGAAYRTAPQDYQATMLAFLRDVGIEIDTELTPPAEKEGGDGGNSPASP